MSGATGGKRKSRSSMLLGLAIFAAAVGGGSFWFIQQRTHTEAAAQERVSAAPKYIVHLEGFTVNLADPQESHFLRATIDLGIDRLPEGAEQDKTSRSLPVSRIRDAILSVLTECKADDLLTPEGKAQLKKNLIGTLNREVPELGVRDVYFTEFLVQR